MKRAHSITTEVELNPRRKWTNETGKTHPPTSSLLHSVLFFCMVGKRCNGMILQNYLLHHHHGNLQLEEEDAVESMAHGPGEEEVAKQMKVGLQALSLVVQSYCVRL